MELVIRGSHIIDSIFSGEYAIYDHIYKEIWSLTLEEAFIWFADKNQTIFTISIISMVCYGCSCQPACSTILFTPSITSSGTVFNKAPLTKLCIRIWCTEFLQNCLFKKLHISFCSVERYPESC